MANSISSPLYLGFDLSTQQLKGIAVGSDLKVVHSALFDFDKDAEGFPDIKKGVLTNEAEREVFAPVAMWLQAVDTVLQRLHDAGIDFGRVAGISGAGQQHGSVYWSMEGPKALQTLAKDETLEKQLGNAFSHPYSPNWQDASTQEQCDMFDRCLGDETQLALNTGSKAHHVSDTQSWLVCSADGHISALRAHRSFALDTSIRRSMLKRLASPLYRLSLHLCFLAM